jgi:hypothetical protein
MPRKSWWARLPFGVRMAAGGTALVVTIGSAVAGFNALTKDRPDAPRIVTAVGSAAGAVSPEAPQPGQPAQQRPNQQPKQGTASSRHPATPPEYDAAASLPRTSNQADRTAPRPPRRPTGTRPQQQQQQQQAGKPAAPNSPVLAAPPVADGDPRPVLTTRTEIETRAIPFQTRLVRDPSLPRGARKIRSAGVPGEQTLRYLVTFTDGKQTERRLLDTTVTREPQDRVIVFGSRRGGNPHDGRGGNPHDGRGGNPHDGRGGKRGNCRFCVPLGRSADCGHEENAIALGGSVTVLDEDLALLDADALGELACGSA